MGSIVYLFTDSYDSGFLRTGMIMYAGGGCSRNTFMFRLSVRKGQRLPCFCGRRKATIARKVDDDYKPHLPEERMRQLVLLLGIVAHWSLVPHPKCCGL